MITIPSFYRDYGFRLHEIPVGKKHPGATAWQKTQQRADDIEPKLQNGYFDKFAVVLDTHHIVIDVDVKSVDELGNVLHGDAKGLESLREIESRLGYTLASVCGAVVGTAGGGRHYYFTKPPEVELSEVGHKYPGIDLITHGFQVVGAGSRGLGKGTCYSFVGDEQPSLKPIPDDLLQLLIEAAKPKPNPTSPPLFNNPDTSGLPGAEFNSSQRGLDLFVAELRTAGYAVRDASRRDALYEWDRPGKGSQSEFNGLIGQNELGKYYAVSFSSSDTVFPKGNRVSLFYGYALLCHRGDTTRAADALYARNFAKPTAESAFEGINLSGILGQANVDQAGRQESTAKADQKPLMQDASDLIARYLERLKSGKVDQLYKLSPALDGLEVGPSLLTLPGAPPGAGKTALAMQIAFEAMQHQPELVVYVANAEMGFDAIIRRELTRLTSIKSEYIRFGVLSEHELHAIEQACAGLASAMQRLKVLPDPDHESLIRLLDQPPGLVIPDYIQKFAPPEKDVRVGVGIVMTTLRRLANHGHAVLALSATKRDTKGNHSSESLGLSSFRESGECEYQADSAYVLRDDGPIEAGREHVRKVTLAHVKNRHGAKVDRELIFNMPKMEFSIFDDLTNPTRFSEFDEYENENDEADTVKPWRQS